MARLTVRSGREEEDDSTFWLITYSDMTTLLLAFFLLMFSFSLLDQQRQQELLTALNSVSARRGAARPVDAERAAREIAAQFGKDTTFVEATESEVTVGLSSGVTFASGEAELTDEARQSLVKVASIVRQLPSSIRVEGHTDDVPVRGGDFANNWELSAARAQAVVRLLIEQGIEPRRLQVVGSPGLEPARRVGDHRDRHRRERRAIVLPELGGAALGREDERVRGLARGVEPAEEQPRGLPQGAPCRRLARRRLARLGDHADDRADRVGHLLGRDGGLDDERTAARAGIDHRRHGREHAVLRQRRGHPALEVPRERVGCRPGSAVRPGDGQRDPDLGLLCSRRVDDGDRPRGSRRAGGRAFRGSRTRRLAPVPEVEVEELARGGIGHVAHQDQRGAVGAERVAEPPARRLVAEPLLGARRLHAADQRVERLRQGARGETLPVLETVLESEPRDALVRGRDLGRRRARRIRRTREDEARLEPRRGRAPHGEHAHAVREDERRRVGDGRPVEERDAAQRRHLGSVGADAQLLALGHGRCREAHRAGGEARVGLHHDSHRPFRAEPPPHPVNPLRGRRPGQRFHPLHPVR